MKSDLKIIVIIYPFFDRQIGEIRCSKKKMKIKSIQIKDLMKLMENILVKNCQN